MRPILFTLAVALLLTGGLQAAPLVGNSTPSLLPLATNTGPTPPGIAPLITYPGGNSGASSFTGTFSSPAPAAWLGTFNGTNPYPCCGNAGTSSWDFTTLILGLLPAGTYMRLGDVDISENFRLTAFDAANNPITSFWLDEPSWLTGSAPAQFVQSNLPSFTFNNGTYSFTGATANSTLTISMLTNVDIYRLEVTNVTTNGFTISAPDSAVPEPSTYATAGLALAALAFARRRRLLC